VADETRYQVFVSSTYADLISERHAVIMALLELGALPAGMELFPAADDDAWVLIKRVIDDSDYYLLVVGGRYGSVFTEGLSYTEREYDYAVSQQKPVMAFLHGDPGKLPFAHSEGDPETREKLAAFRKKVEHAKHVKYWTSADDLSGKIALSFASFIRTYPAVGWVRGDQTDSPETLRKLTAAQEEVSRLKSRLHNRAVEPPAEAKGLADRDETLTVRPAVEVNIRNLSGNTNISPRQTYHGTYSISWNEILSDLGPGMLDEASQTELLARFRRAVEEVNQEEAKEEIRRWLLEGDPKTYLNGNPNFSIKFLVPSKYFETALLQLEALGLIEKGSKKRPIADHNVYWTLTPWGRTRLGRLRAVRSGFSEPPETDDYDDEILSDGGGPSTKTRLIDDGTSEGSSPN
jgi:hypothetical protein